MHTPTREGSASPGASSVDLGDLEEKKEERSSAPSKKLYVGNIPHSENDFEIRALFEKFGIVTDFYRKKDNGQVSVLTNSNF
jgi:RNA recognition motif-containing protein